MTYMLMLLWGGPPNSLYADDFKVWAHFLHYNSVILRRGLPITLFVDNLKAWALALKASSHDNTS